jgi:hypothetical protein
MKDINTHIEYNKQILNDPTVSPQRRRHTQDELSQLEVYKTNQLNPDALECKVYDD